MMRYICKILFCLSLALVAGCRKDVESLYYFVDLGLPSGVKWANCNIGADNSWEYGDYYAWGETSTKPSYTKSNSTTLSNRIVDANGNLTANSDVAQKLGKGHMPTEEDLQELIEECTWTWTTMKDINGYKVTGPNGNSIFLPAAGYCDESSSYSVGSCGYYWSSAYSGNNYAYDLYFSSGKSYWNSSHRHFGFSVRPVYGNPNSSNTIRISSISLNETELTLEVGKTFLLRAAIQPSNATDKSVAYSSSNSKVATVSETGEITANEVGTAVIIATTKNGKTAQCEVTVVEQFIAETAISLNNESISMNAGETEALIATIQPANATNKSVTYNSSNTMVAMVNEEGVINAVGAGTAIIKVRTSNGKTASCKVTVKMIDVISVALSSTSYSMTVDEKITLTPMIFPENATNRTITYSVNNSVVSVSENGVVTANGVGVAIVTATTSNGIMAQCEIIVTPIEATSISLSETNVSIIEGRSFTLKATVLPSNAIDKSISYSVSGLEISVSSSGVVTTNQAGKATITVTASNGVSAQCEVTVLKIPEGFVDLGLSVLWATCNLGASSPEEYGDFYAWGETESKIEYIVENSKRYGVSDSDLKKQGVIDVYGNLTANYDVAQKLGKGRIPTLAEIKELLNKCTWTRITQNGVKGYIVMSKTNGNSIFLPAAGYRDGSSGYGVGSNGCYWTSTANGSSYAYLLLYNSSSYDYRYRGNSVRPVTIPLQNK